MPCHRVVGADGSLTGYGGGLPAKQWLLAHEASHAGLFASASEREAAQSLYSFWAASRPALTSSLDGVGGAVDEEGELLALGGAELAQDVVGRVLAAGRAADAEAHPQVVLAAERGARRAQAVVAALAAAALEPQVAIGQVDVVVDDDEPLERDLVERGDRIHRAARLVHERARLGEHDRHARRADLRATSQRLRWDLNEPPIRSASRSTIRKPALCRVRA